MPFVSEQGIELGLDGFPWQSNAKATGGLRVQGSGFRVAVSGFGFMASGSGFRVSGFGLGFRVGGFGFRV